MVPLEFSLISVDRIVGMACSVGFRPVSLLGDYRGAPYDEKSSPCFIAILERTG
jgi:hypothetical protein